MIRAKPFPRIMLRRRSQPPNGSLPWDTIMGNLSLARLVSGERTHAVFSPSISHLTPRPLSTVSRKPGLHPLDIEDGIYGITPSSLVFPSFFFTSRLLSRGKPLPWWVCQVADSPDAWHEKVRTSHDRYKTW